MEELITKIELSKGAVQLKIEVNEDFSMKNGNGVLTISFGDTISTSFCLKDIAGITHVELSDLVHQTYKVVRKQYKWTKAMLKTKTDTLHLLGRCFEMGIIA